MKDLWIFFQAKIRPILLEADFVCEYCADYLTTDKKNTKRITKYKLNIT